MRKKIEIELINHTSGTREVRGLDGKDGKDGATPTEEQLLALIEPRIPKITQPKDGKSPTKAEIKEIIKEVLPEDKLIEKIIKKVPKGKDGEKGDKGDVFRFADLTPYEKQVLTGPQGSNGVGVPRYGTEGQVLAKRSSKDFDTEWVTGGGGGGTWGSITGTLADQTDLQIALNLKANTADLATVATTGSYDDLSDKPTIPTGTIDGTLTTNELVYSVDSNTVGSLAVATYPSLPELAHVKGVTSAIQTQLNGKEPTKGSDDNYVTDAQLIVIGNTSGTNSGNQTITNSSDATSHTVTLSASGGSVQLIEGTNITLTTGGTASAGTVTIAASGGSGDVTKVGTPVDNQVGVWTGDGTIEGDVDLTFDTSTNTLGVGLVGLDGRVQVHAVKSDASDGLLIEASNGTDVGLLGVGNTANATWNGSHNFEGGQVAVGKSATTLGKLKLYGNTSGDVTIQPNAVAGTGVVLTAPATTGTLALTSDIPAAGANTALSNLASVAINTSLVSDTDNTDDLGTTLKKWANLFVTTIGATATRVTKGWFTDLEVTNAIAGSVTGSAATLTTSRTIGTATGDVTSAGSSFNGSANNTNAYTIANSAVTLAKMANLAQDQFIGRTTASTGVPETATITAAARTVLDDTTVAAMVDTLGGAASTGTGGIARATSPTFVTPALGTPSALVATNATGTATGLTSGITNALKSATTTVDVSAATAPSSGQVLTATSSTAATWQTPSSPLTVEYSFSTAFETTTRGVPQTSGSGNTVTATSGGLRCNGGSANGYASSKIPMGQSNGFKVFSGNPKFSAQMYWTYSKSGGNDEVTIAFCGIGDPGTSLTSESFVTNHIGFMVTSTAGGALNLYATNANGSSQTKSASLETAVTGTNYEFFISVTSDTNIAYYWRKNGGAWSSVLNHTTNIPSSSTSEQHCTVGLIHTEAITGSDNDAYIGGMTYKR